MASVPLSEKASINFLKILFNGVIWYETESDRVNEIFTSIRIFRSYNRHFNVKKVKFYVH